MIVSKGKGNTYTFIQKIVVPDLFFVNGIIRISVTQCLCEIKTPNIAANG